MSAGFVKAIADRLIGKTVEIYQGETHETVLWADKERERKSIIYGVLIEAFEECLIVEVEDEGDINQVYINSWTVHSMLEVKNKMSIFDVYSPDERKK